MATVISNGLNSRDKDRIKSVKENMAFLLCHLMVSIVPRDSSKVSVLVEPKFTQVPNR